ncbi:uncharacterized protein LOC120626938 [Pararge aegeria]|uniref:uncharacterized protein LOC120626938 n=1 Tax=Pararge aegeria TaxID=116150 RepID=UPI0019CF97FF|nr:uncharacterized protein LOC120626938 [Pararge aegeria]
MVPSPTLKLFTAIHRLNFMSISTEGVKFISSRKGNCLLLYKSFTYNKQSTNKNGEKWYCSSRRSRNCTAQTFLANDGSITDTQIVHSHPPPEFYVDKHGGYVRLS